MAKKITYGPIGTTLIQVGIDFYLGYEYDGEIYYWSIEEKDIPALSEIDTVRYDQNGILANPIEGFQYMPNRIETLFEIITYYRQMKKYRLAFHFYKIAFEYKNKIREPEEELFLRKDIYEYRLDYELILIAYYLNIDKNSINDYCLSILNLPNAEVSVKDNILTNLKFYYFDLSYVF